MAGGALSNRCDILLLLHSRHRLPLRRVSSSHFRPSASNQQRQPLDESHPTPSTSSPSQQKQPQPSPSVQSAFAKAAAYRKSLQKSGADNPPSPYPISESSADAPNNQQKPTTLLQDLAPGFTSRSRSAQEAEMAWALRKEEESSSSSSSSSSQGGSSGKQGEDFVEVEIITRDGVIKRKESKRPEEYYAATKQWKTRAGVSSTDFLGLDFSEKKKYYSGGGKPAGLAAGFDPPPAGALPEVEIITRDGNPGTRTAGDLYKPKVATWGVFERPANISRTYGGGRVIKPGEPLETEEEMKAREERSKQLLAAYHKKIGLDVDPEVKADCEKALKLGNESLGKGELQRAMQYFEKVMQKMPYQSQIHGTAALQLALCLDSSARFQEARELYEKIANHPNTDVRRKTKQLLFGFKAMDALNVSATSNWDGMLYEKYFNAFSDGYNNLYKPDKHETSDEDMMQESFVYIGLMIFPLILFLLALLLKGK